MTRLAVIGAGYWGQKVVSEYAELVNNGSNLESIAVVDTSRDAGQIIRKHYPTIRSILTNAEEIFSDESIDAVHICTPNETHFSLGTRALESGKHVLLEKPMAMTAADAYKLVEVASRHHRILQVGHIFRFNAAINFLRSFIKAGNLGRIYSVRIRWTTNMVPLPDRDIIFDLGPHPVDIANFILDEWPAKVTGKSKSHVRQKVGREEEAIVVLEFPKQKDALIELSWISPGEKIREVYVRGSKATARVDALNQTIRLYSDSNGMSSMNDGEAVGLVPNNTIADEIKSFLAHITNPSKNISSGYVGARTTEVLEAVRTSVLDERTVYLKEIWTRNYGSKLDSRSSARPEPKTVETHLQTA